MKLWVKKTLARSGLEEEETSSRNEALLSLNGRALELKPRNPSTMSCNQEIGDSFNGSSNEVGDELAELPRGGMVSFQAHRRSKSSLSSKHSRAFSVDSPQYYQESCFITQRYRQHVGTDEYVFTPCSSPSRRTVRQLFVTDGKRIISRESSDSYSGESVLQQDNGSYMKGIALDAPLVQVTDFVKGKVNRKGGKGQCRRPSGSEAKVSSKPFLSQGSLDGLFLLCLGINIGMMSADITNQREVDKLKEQLKQKEKDLDKLKEPLKQKEKDIDKLNERVKQKENLIQDLQEDFDKLNERVKQKENLIQDLQEELEMKDSLTVKELANEGCDSQETSDRFFNNRVPTSFSSEQELESLHYDSKRTDYPKPVENSESMSQIEAELQAELERLELNMNASSLETRILDFAELDSDLVGIVVQGELRADMVNNRAGFEANSNIDASGTSTTQTENLNDAVSPRELRLKIVEAMEARLVSQSEQILELESEVKNSHEKMEKMESELKTLQRDFSNSKIVSLPQESLTTTEEGNTVTQPLFLNLTEDALDAYNECYDELMRISGTDGEDTPVAKERLHPLSKNISLIQNGGEENGSVPHYKMLEEEREPRTILCDRNRTWGRFSTSRGSSEVGEFEDENAKDHEDSVEEEDDDDDDDDDELLIKQILEKTKQGSPLVLNVQRMLLSMDEKL